CSRSREVLDVLQERLPRVAGWSAEDPRRADAQEEQAIVGGVPLEVRPPAPSRLSAAWCSYRKSTRASGNVPPIFGRGYRKLARDLRGQSPGLAISSTHDVELPRPLRKIFFLGAISHRIVACSVSCAKDATDAIDAPCAPSLLPFNFEPLPCRLRRRPSPCELLHSFHSLSNSVRLAA